MPVVVDTRMRWRGATADAAANRLVVVNLPPRHSARYERAERGYSAWLGPPMLILQRGYCKVGAVVELVVGVAAESTASRRAGR